MAHPRWLVAVAAGLLLSGCGAAPPEAVRTAQPAASTVSESPVAPESTPPAATTPSAPPPPVTPAPVKPSTSAPAKPTTPAPAKPATSTARSGTPSGPAHGDAVVLSFDDCPKSMEEFKTTVLAAEKLGIAVVLFPTGNCVTTHRIDPDFARAHGAYVFNHSVTHPDLRKVSAARLKAELGAPGIVTNWGRPPFGAVNATVRNAYAAAGMKVWMWDVDTLDWKGKSTDELVNYVVANTRAGDTVLMHMHWNGFNPDALTRMKAGLNARGLQVCRNRGPVAVAPTFAC